MNKYSGSNFDDFLEEEGILEEVTTAAKNRLKKLDKMSGPVGVFLQWIQFNNQLVFRTASICFLIAIGVYFGNRFLSPGTETQHLSAPVPLSEPVPDKVEPILVKGQGKVVRVSKFGFGAFPKVPSSYPDQDIWDTIQKRSVHDPKGAKTLELLARVRIKLWQQGKHTKGVIMDPSSGLIYPDSGIEILSYARAHGVLGQFQYDGYFDDGLVPKSVKFQEEGIDPYKFLNLTQ